jgi:hypothetical protein
MRNKRTFLSIALSILASVALTSSSLATTPTPAEIDTRLLAQEGLAIAFASTVLQTQLEVLAEVISPQPLTCENSGGNPVQVVSSSVSNGVTAVNIKFFFDAACKDLYAHVRMNSEFSSGAFHLTGEARYYNRQSVLVGSMAINEHAYGTGATVDSFVLDSVAGLGTFTPVNGRPPVSLGLACRKVTSSIDNSTPLPCEGGVAQSFRKLGISLGSISPLKLNVSDTPLTFSGSGSVMVTAPLGTLSVGRSTPSVLGLVGNYEQFTTSSAAGEAGTFSLFPPTPTQWTLTDTAHHQKFSISVVSNTTLNSVGTVINTNTNATLATINVDQSGTGTIKYADGSSPPVTSWTLGD